MPAALTFFKYERIIQVDAPQTSVEIQDLHDQIRLYEEQLINLDYGTIANAYGKQPLGGGSYIGITLELINNWRLSFEARDGLSGTILCTVSGGNLVAINDYANNPIYPTAFTQVVIAQSSSPTIIQADADYATLYLLESLRGKNKSIGSIWYWNPDPTKGNDGNDGTTPANAVLTFDRAQQLATPGAGAGDIIFALSTTSGGVTTTETLDITIDNLKLRGPGYPFKLTGTEGSPTINIQADNVEVSGFYITTAAGGTDNGITVTGDRAQIEDCWVYGATGSGIDISSSARTIVETCVVENCKGNGINMGDYTTLSTVRKCIVTGSGTVPTPADGVVITGSNSTDNIFENNIIYNNTSYGINVGNGVVRTGIRLHNTFSGNTAGSTQSVGSVGTFIDTGGAVTGDDITNIVNGVWDEVITSGHTVTGSAAKTLKDAKTKATLASLK
ncbi:TPA: hypothetical protein DEQ95_00385 [Candidatus Beckwithbacteria bacterium]|nr:MAG: hypothetical protein UY43_C0001G0264 [Candidatus Beckwithbacteria bacterium GW2011_GWC1_49_16]KKU35186.1 MAG: hypothetical protein UX50_C0005G0009 [Candidatus Beckwithbacteria bacterium GW2011_GWA1_46_30]KKU71740.1 MAG: hypothetical protein UX97_C0004G0063 [Candidatus Beckwithbacteria bacterium GW2011_GWA2_47_25]KKW03838.1 MAG: hypothetical protein UY37_C0004G0131 [Candidatus Beckwithbacteria bacterium GW2011_GWC2_49_11]OGD48137.1 MAG: hypothetical protein A2877_00345 [Candidatus Beckwi